VAVSFGGLAEIVPLMHQAAYDPSADRPIVPAGRACLAEAAE
jgi:hypothetical protein